MPDRLTTNVCNAAAFNAVRDSERATNLPSAAVPLSCVCLEACRAERSNRSPNLPATDARASSNEASSSSHHGNTDHDGMKREGQRKVGNYSDRERNGIITPTADRNRGSARVGTPLERDAVKYRPSQE
jgi:hypothetical protein